MAEDLALATSILAVVELAAKAGSVCFKYSQSVKHAQSDISRFQTALSDGRLPATNDVLKTSNECYDHLNVLLRKLEIPTKKRYAILGRLKWPFASKEVEKEILNLDRYSQRIQFALQIDSIGLVDDFSMQMILDKLPWAAGATFDAFEESEELNAVCLENTRVELLQTIRDWITDSNGKPLFWLNGMAGTGKSTVSRTLCKEFAQKKQLGASFFFKEGENDRQSARRFYTTIAAQLIHSVPMVALFIRKTLEADPHLATKSIDEQFEKLILEPLTKIKTNAIAPVLIVVDALDECKPGFQIKIILNQFSRLQTLYPLHVRVFLTSRPEEYLRAGFQQLTSSIYQHIILHEIHESVIKNDIATFIEYRFNQIRSKHEDFDADWPGKTILSSLIMKSQPLFIYAATICRFIDDPMHDPQSRLEAILSDRDGEAYDKVHQAYRPILDRLLAASTKSEQVDLIKNFGKIVGSIVVIFEPLSIKALAIMLDLDVRMIKFQLNGLHSLLNVPANLDLPVRILHLSFVNFLLDRDRHDEHPFWLDAKEIHKDLAGKCLDHVLSADCLSTSDICELRLPGISRTDIDEAVIERYLPIQSQYACRYWIHHLRESGCKILSFEERILTLCETRFMIWFEALSLLGRASEMTSMLSDLTTLVSESQDLRLSAIVYDLKRFAMANSYIADIAPLQLYSSCLIFAPVQSVVRTNNVISSWIKRPPIVLQRWDYVLQTLEAHSNQVTSVAFSPCGERLASGSSDKTIRLWEITSGQLEQTVTGHSEPVSSVTFSPDGRLLASGSEDHTIKLWDAVSGDLISTLTGHLGSITSIAFSHDSKRLASGSLDKTIRFWNTPSGYPEQTFLANSKSIHSIDFSPDSNLIVSGLGDGAIKLWEARLQKLVLILGSLRVDPQTYPDWKSPIRSVVFSPNGKYLAAVSRRQEIMLWEVISYNPLQIREVWGIKDGFHIDPPPYYHSSGCLAFASDSKTLALTFWYHGCIYLYNVISGQLQHIVGPTYGDCLAFIPNGNIMSSGCPDGTIKLWDMTAIHLQERQALSKVEADLYFLTLSKDGKHLAALEEFRLKLWNIKSGQICLRCIANPPDARVGCMGFSPDSELLAVGLYDGTIELRSVVSSQLQLQRILENSKTCDKVDEVVFSQDGKSLVSSIRYFIQIWDVSSGQLKQMVEATKSLDDRLGLYNKSRRLEGYRSGVQLHDDLVFAEETNPAILTFEDGWIMRSGRRLLWIPSMYRNWLACCNDQIAFIAPVNQIILIELCLDEQAGLSDFYSTEQESMLTTESKLSEHELSP